MNAFFHALSFFTRIPVPWLRPSEEAWKKSVVWYPAVGLVIGLVLCGVHQAALWAFAPLTAAVLTMACWVYITGGLHLDGWMDLADGLGSSRPREQMLAIMKDSRTGAMGVLAAIVLLLVKTAALAELDHRQLAACLLLVPAAARTHVLLAIRCWPYVTGEKGVGKSIGEALRPFHIGAGYLFVLALGWWLADIRAVTAVVLSLVISLLFARSVAGKLGGLTGDCYGALIEIAEAVMLLILIGSWWP
ncbi:MULTISPECIES: adenosylcobinamide-GDP ribazoletransferase [Brevibacillus]|jgi:adenosylcobinamide-GDP ribazoletransferase|uniref:Adenosylcobinamide-GDP ribazoletransferase n=1 Tax=Brevibacillus aydinogluensis TaxID=927786 RepID=A0AA48RFG7_9BACL|nr:MULTISPECIES: adenosylcobinamide-GDP ribazoletransferase [Bacillales]REK62652.1 MAG: adenosylcobinamide-GDP ribazoletransferase [Brevibacillus sp.]UFJ59634.1 adenosylcobinamide-GDP ribazoletransferase [Anoxybacillus sediminis]CAJ1003773.1 adenosylcobinamide-GDP ribazoletransferase [Brevibacillus aydinogluensis]